MKSTLLALGLASIVIFGCSNLGSPTPAATSGSSTSSTGSSSGGTGSSPAVVRTLAGGSGVGFVDGTGGRSGTAEFNQPTGIAVDPSGQILVADFGNERIRRIDGQGNVTTVAGTGNFGDLDGSTSIAELYSPARVAVDGAGNLYIADQGNERIRKIDTSGQVSSVAGDGTEGYLDGPGDLARFFDPDGLAVDAQGDIFVADSRNNRIRKIDALGNVTTVAGNGTAGFADGTGGPTGTAEFSLPVGVALAGDGALYVADTGNNRIRKVDVAGSVTTVAGGEAGQFADGPPGSNAFYGPTGVAFDAEGNLYIADQGNGRIRVMDAAGVVRTLAGDGSLGFVDGTSTAAEFDYPTDVAVDALHNVYVVDLDNNCVRMISQ